MVFQEVKPTCKILKLQNWAPVMMLTFSPSFSWHHFLLICSDELMSKCKYCLTPRRPCIIVHTETSFFRLVWNSFLLLTTVGRIIDGHFVFSELNHNKFLASWLYISVFSLEISPEIGFGGGMLLRS